MCVLDQVLSTYLHLLRPPKSLNHSYVKNRLFCGRPSERRWRKNEWVSTPQDRSVALFMSITKFLPQNPVYNSVHLLRTAVLGKGDIFGSNSKDAWDASLGKLIIICRVFNSLFPHTQQDGQEDKPRIKEATFILLKVSSSVAIGESFCKLGTSWGVRQVDNIALCRSWKKGSKVVNFDKLVLRGFWPKIHQILHTAASTPQKPK